MKVDDYSSRKKVLKLENARVAFIEEGSGEPLVMLHGFPNSAIWRKVIPILSVKFRCLAIDTLGLGDSVASSGRDYTLKGQAEMIESFLQAKGIERFYLLGQDLGGAIAQILAIRKSERVEKLVLADCAAYDNWPSRELKGLISLAKIPMALGVFCRRMQRIQFARSSKGWGHAFFNSHALTEELVRAYIRPIGSSTERIESFRKLLLSLDNRETMEIVPALKRFQSPTMVLWSCDNLHRSPSWAIQLYQDIPGAVRFELIPFAGLFSPEEKPTEFAGIVADFLTFRKQVANPQDLPFSK